MNYIKPNQICYRIAQGVSWVAAKLIFGRKILRNEIKGKKGAFVVIANHQAALDFVNLIGLSIRRMTFVISNSFYSTLPIKGLLDKIGVIPKQQFQTTVGDMKQIKAVADSGAPLVIYPAGLMCEDGISTPIPKATYKTLKWLGVDVYVAKVSGTYFAMPKWAKGIRPGRTYIDVYKLFSKEELEQLDISKIKEKTDEALLFDAYREQEELKVKYLGGSNIEGLENVLYRCPDCGTEFAMHIKNKRTIFCEKCGFEQSCDKYGFFHNEKQPEKEMRYVSDWSVQILSDVKRKVESGEETSIASKTEIHMIDRGKKKFAKVGEGIVKLTKDGFSISGVIDGEEKEIGIQIANVPTLPFSPGKYFEIQSGSKIYRCVLEDGKLVMKFINMLKAFYEIKQTAVAVRSR